MKRVTSAYHGAVVARIRSSNLNKPMVDLPLKNIGKVLQSKAGHQKLGLVYDPNLARRQAQRANDLINVYGGRVLMA